MIELKSLDEMATMTANELDGYRQRMIAYATDRRLADEPAACALLAESARRFNEFHFDARMRDAIQRLADLRDEMAHVETERPRLQALQAAAIEKQRHAQAAYDVLEVTANRDALAEAKLELHNVTRELDKLRQVGVVRNATNQAEEFIQQLVKGQLALGLHLQQLGTSLAPSIG